MLKIADNNFKTVKLLWIIPFLGESNSHWSYRVVKKKLENYYVHYCFVRSDSENQEIMSVAEKGDLSRAATPPYVYSCIEALV